MRRAPLARIACALIAAAVIGCAREPAVPPLGNTAAPDDAAVGRDAAPGDAAASCVADCVRRRQMEATSMDFIRASCAERCAP
jgi:hypothetical protein